MSAKNCSVHRGFLIRISHETNPFLKRCPLEGDVHQKKVSVIARFQCRKERKGKERKGKERKERKGKERKGKERKGKERKEALLHNLSMSGEVGRQPVFFQIIITGKSPIFWEKGAFRSGHFKVPFVFFFRILLKVNDVLCDRMIKSQKTTDTMTPVLYGRGSFQ